MKSSAALLLLALLAGCANPVDAVLRRHVETIEQNWPKIRDKSAPAAGVDSDSYARASDAMTRAVEKAGEAARHE